MVALVIYLGIVLVVFLVRFSVAIVKDGYSYIVPALWLIAILSVAFGMCIEHGGKALASDYLKDPESYQVDTFMKNGEICRFEVSKK